MYSYNSLNSNFKNSFVYCNANIEFTGYKEQVWDDVTRKQAVTTSLEWPQTLSNCPRR